MKKSILFFVLLFVFSACETGTRYDKNVTSTKKVPTAEPEGQASLSLDEHRSYANKDIENLLRDNEEKEVVEERFEEPVAERSYIERDKQEDTVEDTFNGGATRDGLNVKSIRVGEHDGYTRLVFDVYNGANKSTTVGTYKAQYYERRDDIAVLLEGYRHFSAKFPRFSRNSVIEKIYFERYEDDSAFKFHI